MWVEMPLVELYAGLLRSAGTMVEPDVDPLSTENILLFTYGPLTGTGYQTSDRFSVAIKNH